MTFNLEPCKRDGRGRKVADYRPRNFYEKISEELFEAYTEAVYEIPHNEAFELLHVMTACVARIAALDLSDELLTDLQQRVIERNRERGYFTEKSA